MTKQSKNLVVLTAVIVLGLGVFSLLNSVFHFSGGHGRVVDALIARNVAARGGSQAWEAISTLQLKGQMDLGQGMHVPYVMEQKRPGKMCIEFVFDDKTAVQCVDGNSGWKVLPFLGRNRPEAMTEQELREMADAADIDGLLFNSAERGYKIEHLGNELVAGRVTQKLQVTLPRGALRWVYIDDETGLDIKLESLRVLQGKQRRVETYYYDWQDTDGLLIPRRQETQTEGDDESHFLTVDSVRGNLPLDDSRFVMPANRGGTTS